MKLTRHEWIIVCAVPVVLLTGFFVKRYREAHPPAKPVPAAIRGR